ncbi:hypothetical protein TRFO_40279 [Tritrichomonas foetus]|uniref:Uncharacterized protein n=1 Tax=Tritrichomonas foetus TaxID=1144522 RepID=A0A1J4J3Y5_9EUKA|nr:hypothetical protein TRFO_40279 [Tritrichomonas foetus]|eukprot:OHS93457.1 hypothetical protein TRFO_40279 [Tritrichomonas foetus]
MEASDTITLPEFIETTASIRAIAISNNQFDSLIENYCEDILKLSLSSEGGSPGIKAFTLLTKRSMVTSTCLLKHNLFFGYISNILMNVEGTPPFVLSRIAAIYLNIVLSEVEGRNEAVGYLIQFLDFTDNTGVLDMFKEIFSSDANVQWLYQVLFTIKFHAFVLDEFQKDINDDHLAALLEIVHMCALNETLRSTFCTKEFAKILLKIIKNENPNSHPIDHNINSFEINAKSQNSNISNKNKNGLNMNELGPIDSHAQEGNGNKSHLRVLNSLWLAISSVCSTDNLAFMIPILKKSIEIIRNTTKQVHAYHEGILIFLEKVMVLNDKCFGDNNKNLMKSLCRLMVAFPDVTPVQNAIFNLIISALKSDNFRKITIRLFLPLAITMSMNDKRSAASANCAKLVNYLSFLKKSINDINVFLNKSTSYKECNDQFLKDYKTKLLGKYGGKCKNKVNKQASIKLKQTCFPLEISLDKIIVDD